MSNNSSDYIKTNSNNSSNATYTIDLEGSILNEKYLIIYKIGSGAFSTVWLTYNILNKKFYAIKIHNPEDFEAGEKEVNIYNKIEKSTNIYLNKLVDSFIFDNDLYCLVFDLLACSLYDIYTREELDFDTKKIIVKQILEGLRELHDKYDLIHTDLKLENILLVGTSKKNKLIIDKFNELNFANFLKKNKKKKNKKVLEKTGKEFIEKLFSKLGDLDVEGLEGEEVVGGGGVDFDFSKNKSITIKLADFGTCVEKKNISNYDIQTRYYRAPEVILNHQYNETIDTWSMGCLMFELFTRELLFDPDKNIRASRDKCHLIDIISLLGPIPVSILEKSKKADIFFTRDFNLKHRSIIKYISLSKRLNMSNCYLVDLLYKMLNYDPVARLSIKKCLDHHFFVN